MAAKAIIERYLKREGKLFQSCGDGEDGNSGKVTTPEELRRHIAAVASGAGLRLTDEELDELAGITTPSVEAGHPSGGGEWTTPPVEAGHPSGGGEGRKKKRAVSGDLKAAGEKSGDTTSTEI